MVRAVHKQCYRNAYRGHGYDEKVDAVPVGHVMSIAKLERVARILEQVDEPGGRQPDGDDDRDQLGEADGGRCLEHIQIL